MRFIPLEHLDIEQATAKLAEFCEKAAEIAGEDGIDEDRVGVISQTYDDFAAWLTVDEVPVFRAALVPQADEDGKGYAIHAFGSWLPAYRQFLDHDKVDLGDFDDNAEDTDPDVLSN